MNKVEIVVERFKPAFNDSLPELSTKIGIHRSTLHHAMRRGSFSTKMQKAFMNLSQELGIDLDPAELLNV